MSGRVLNAPGALSAAEGNVNVGGSVAAARRHWAALLKQVWRVNPLVGEPEATLAYGAATSLSGARPAGSGGRFQVLRPHARGGLGEVSVALDHELAREVALKRIQPRLADDPAARFRFELEARITGALEHPGVVPIYSFGYDSEQRPYYAMRFIQGESLQDALDRFHRDQLQPGEPQERWLRLRRLVDRFIDVCNAVAFAHDRGVVHRDLKPSNIMIGKYGETLVVDWGVARWLGGVEPGSGAAPQAHDASRPRDTAGTLPGSAIGTPLFMSPEQAAGRLQDVGPRSDVYSLGATLYMILTGRAPHDGRSTTTGILEAVEQGHITRPVSVNPHVPRPLDAVCMKAMATRPEVRYATPRALADDLERWLADEPVSAWREPLSVRTQRWMRRHRALVAASIVAAVVTAGGAGTVAAVQARANWQLDQKNVALRSANDQIARTRDQAESRAGLAIDAIQRFRTAVDENVDVKNRPELADLRQSLLQGPAAFYQTLEKDLLASGDTRPQTQGRLAAAYAAFADLSREVGSQADATGAYRGALEVVQRLAESDPANPSYQDQLAALHNSLGELSKESRSLDEALGEYEQAVRHRQSIRRQHPDDLDNCVGLATVLANLGTLKADQGRVDEALADWEDARALLDDVLAGKPQQHTAQNLLVRVHVLLANALNSQKGRPLQARAELEQAREIAETLASAEPAGIAYRQSLASVWEALSGVQSVAENSDEALASLQAALQIRRALLGEHPSYSQLQVDLADALMRLHLVEFDRGLIQDSLDAVGQSRMIYERLAADHPQNLRYQEALSNVLLRSGNAYYMAGRKQESLAAFQTALPVLAGLAQADPTNLPRRRVHAGVQYNIGILHLDLGEHREALATCQSALALRRQLVQENPENPELANDVAFTLGNMGVTHELVGEYQQALALQIQARDIQRELVKGHPDVAKYAISLARSLRNIGAGQMVLGESASALASLEESLALLKPLVERDPSQTLLQRDLVETYHNMARTHV